MREIEDRPRSYFIVTYGCQMNAHDSEILAGMMNEMGMTPAAAREEAELILFNTCCIRDNAERKALLVMGLGAGATLEDVKSKYKALVKQHHPDANGGDRSTEDRLIEIIKAYNYLKTVVREA